MTNTDTTDPLSICRFCGTIRTPGTTCPNAAKHDRYTETGVPIR